MTGQSAEFEPEASNPAVLLKRNADSSESGHRKQRRLSLSSNSCEATPLSFEPSRRVQADGTSAVPLPSEAFKISRYSLPLFLQPLELPPPDPVLEQMMSVQQHAYRVTHGLCWQEEVNLPSFEDSMFTYGDCELPPEAKWTSHQKYQFIELLGRRSPANLESIAKTVGKSLIDCELYLSVLKSGAEGLSLDHGEIPEAEEVLDPNLEPTLFEYEEHIFGDVDEKKECFIRLDRLEKYMVHSFAADGISALVRAVTDKLRSWIEGARHLAPYEVPNLGPILQFFDNQPRRELGFDRPDEEQRSHAPPIPGTGPLPYDSSIGEGIVGVPESEDEDEDEDDEDEDEDEDEEDEEEENVNEENGHEDEIENLQLRDES